MHSPKVTILQHRLLHYRVPLFEKLKEHCKDLGITLNLVHGQAPQKEKQKKDEGYLPWAYRVHNKFVNIGGKDILWQPFPRGLRDSDLIVVMQENKIVSNYPIILGAKLNNKKVAYWGHGVNFQSLSPSGLRERWKRFFLCKVDWWFAYTEMTVNILKQSGFPDDRITCLNNSIDMRQFKRELANVSTETINEIKAECRLEDSSQIALFCGSLYPEKHLGFLMKASDIIKEKIPAFKLILIGDGPQADEVKTHIRTRPWVSWVGARKGQEKANYYKIARVILNPGALGLNILDAFSAGLPMVSTNSALHGPEISYIDHARNGYLTNFTLHDYSTAVIKILSDSDLYKRLSDAAYQSGTSFSMEHMVERFVDGIRQCLSR